VDWDLIDFEDPGNEDTRQMAPAPPAQVKKIMKAIDDDFQLIEAVIIDSGEEPLEQDLHKDVPLRGLGARARKGWVLEAFLFPLHGQDASLITARGEICIPANQHARFCPVSTPHAGSARPGKRLHVICARKASRKKPRMAFKTLKGRYQKWAQDVMFV
jgi:hypothetical protein